MLRKLLRIIRKTYEVLSLLVQLLEYSIQPITRLKIAPQIYSESALKGKDLLKFQKFRNLFCKATPFSWTLQPCSPEFPTSANRLHNFFWVFWNSWKIARKGLHTLRKSIQLDLSTLKRFWIDLLLNFTMTMT